MAKRRHMPLKKKAATLVEIVVATIILASVFAGVLASFMAVRGVIARANRRLTGVNITRTTFNNLYPHVNAISWNAVDLANANVISSPTIVVDGVPYTYTKTTNSVGVNQYRQVNVSINYPDN